LNALSPPLQPLRDTSSQKPRPPQIPYVGLLFGCIAFSASFAFGRENSFACFLLALATIPLAEIAWRITGNNSSSPVTLFAILYLLFGLIMPGIAQAANGTFPFYRMQYPQADVFLAALIIFIFALSFSTGHWLGAIARSRHSNSLFSLSPYSPILSAALSLVALGLAISVGLDTFTAKRGESTFFAAGSLGIALNSFVRFSSFASVLILLYGWTRSAKRKITIIDTISAASVFAIFIVLNHPFTIPRFYLLAYVVSSIVVVAPLHLRWIKRAILFMYPAAIISIFPILTFFSRGRGSRDPLSEWRDYYLTSGDLDGLQSVINIHRYVDIEGLRLGRQLISAIFVLVPRSIWDTKAPPTGSLASATNGYQFLNISAPIPGEIYIDFGWAGIFLGGIVIGFLVSSLDRLFRQGKERGDAVAILSVALTAGFIAILFRGSLLAAIAPCVLAIVTVQAVRLCQSRRAAK
jgi:hypothetical protein